MTTREIYFKNLIECDLPLGIIFYVVKDENDVIQIGKSIIVRFEDHEKNITYMKEIEKTNGFMFWSKSTEAEDFFKKNIHKISLTLFEGLKDIQFE